MGTCCGGVGTSSGGGAQITSRGGKRGGNPKQRKPKELRQLLFAASSTKQNSSGAHVVAASTGRAAHEATSRDWRFVRASTVIMAEEVACCVAEEPFSNAEADGEAGTGGSNGSVAAANAMRTIAPSSHFGRKSRAEKDAPTGEATSEGVARVMSRCEPAPK